MMNIKTMSMEDLYNAREFYYKRLELDYINYERVMRYITILSEEIKARRNSNG